MLPNFKIENIIRREIASYFDVKRRLLEINTNEK